jgi:hypothetical protein
MESASEIDNLRETIVKYHLEDNFGIDVQIKVTNLEFWTLPVQLNSLVLSPKFYYKI